MGLAVGLIGRACAAESGVPLNVPATGHPGFTVVDSMVSGVRFTNGLSPLEAAQNQNLMNGSGVAAGDFDGDGKCDLYFCAISGTNRLYRNLGNWRFEEVTEKAGVACPQWRSTGAVFADVDGDGDLDLLVSTLGSGVHCFRNDGGGHFTDVTAEAGLTSSTGSMSVALGDVDGDGDLDLYVANYGSLPVMKYAGRADVKRVNGEWVIQGPYANRLRVVDNHLEEVGEVGVLYLNDGAGHFKAVPWNSEYFVDERGKPKPPPPDYGLSVQIRDVNGDGAPDIYICDDFQTPDRLWINDGKGHFREASHLAIRKFPFSSMGVDFADLDRDGQLDFIAVEMAGKTHSRRMRQLTGINFQPNIPGRFEYRPEVARNTLYHGNGDGTWSEIAEYSGVTATDWSWQPVFLDVDLDGFEDLLVVSGMMYDTQDRDTLDRIKALGRQTGPGSNTNLLLYPSFPSTISAFRNRGDLKFEACGAAWGFDTSQIAQGIALADLDGDGDLDLAVNCMNGPALLYRNETAAPRIAVRLKGAAPNTSGIGARIKVSGGSVIQSQEIVAGGRYLSGDEAMRVFAAGSAKQLTIDVKWRSGRETTVTNASPNRLYELVEDAAASPTAWPEAAHPTPLFSDQTAGLHHAHREPLFDDFARQPLLPKQLSSLGPGVAWCDFDNSGRDDLVIGVAKGGRLEGRRFAADLGVSRLSSDWMAPDDMAGFTAWTAPDGRPALLAAVGNYETAPTNTSNLVLISAAHGALAVTPFTNVPPSDASTGPLAAGDYDGDGKLDLFVGGRVLPGGYPQAVSSRLFRNTAAGLVPDAEANRLLDHIGMVSGAVWSDLDGGGFPDLILACEWGPVRIFRNDHGRLSSWDPPVARGASDSTNTQVPLSSMTGWWNSVTTGDFDGDGRMDVIAGNWGLNSGYSADASRPVRLYYGDLAGAGMTDLVESYYPSELVTEMPRRSRNALGHAFPLLTDRFPTHAAFSVATISDVLGALPAKPRTLVATTLATTLFLNRGSYFVAVPLPKEAQWTPVFGMTVADVDGDGNEDLFLAQNFFAMRPEWPRTDAGRGLWLKGDGRGGFATLAAAESGIRIFGEERGAAVGDFNHDGRVDLIVAQNGSDTTLWQNDHAKPGLAVRLQGPPGNPCGYGGAIRLESTSGKGPVRELHAGGGYWSQDSATQVLGIGNVGDGISVWVRWPGGKVTETRIPSNLRFATIDLNGHLLGGN